MVALGVTSRPRACPYMGIMANEDNPEFHHRRSIRLKGYDYAQPGAYFVTVCTQNRRCVFGEITDGTMQANETGRMVHAVWEEIPRHYPADIDAFVVMPNHIHGIILLNQVPPLGTTPRGRHVAPNVGATPCGRPRGHEQAQWPASTLGLPDVVHRFKSLTTTRYQQGVVKSGWPPFGERLWQRNYYEHVVRNDEDMGRIREYIANNPIRWTEDRVQSGVHYLEPNPKRQVIRCRKSGLTER